MINVKICCIATVEEAQLAIQSGASAVGLVANMPSGPGIISDEKIAKIIQTIPQNIDSFLLTSETAVDKIIKHHQFVKSNTIQLVDALSSGTYKELKSALPSVNIVQVIHVLDEKTIDMALKIAEEVDFLLLDSGNPNLKIKELGGTGKTHNWDISRQIVAQSPIPVYLAGGINSENVRNAIETVRPFGIDLCSSVRTNGILDKSKLETFFKQLL